MKSILCYSGGIDSTVLLADLLASGAEVICLTVLYGQRHTREASVAQEIAAHYGVQFVTADLSAAAPLFNGSALTDTEGALIGAATVVPNRNMVLLSLAGALAVSREADIVAFGPHAGDAAIYPDCRLGFVNAARRTLLAATEGTVGLIAPFLDRAKAEIVKRGADLAVPFALTWSCYAGGSNHCGRCDACTGRRESFNAAGIHDPTRYKA